jgi:8-oxo-dGTP pyrophosphatase MutT (NUDIX family)
MGKIPVRPAATIVVIRYENSVPEILMLRRNSAALTATGAHVFPGGGVDDGDRDVVHRQLLVGLDEAAARRRLHLPEDALTYYCAALRELFEEAGILLAVPGPRQTYVLHATTLALWRRELRSGDVSWAQFLIREGLYLDLSGVAYLAHWVTPEGRARRFDTRFFVTQAPDGQSASPDGDEVVEHVWVGAGDALERHRRGEWTLLYPTTRTLELLSSFATVDDVLAYAVGTDVVRVQPREIDRDGVTIVVGPGEPGYRD